MSNCLTFTSLSKISLGSINGAETEGNISTVKKITLPNGEELPYVSGQSLRRMIRDRLVEAGEQLSPLNLTDDNMAARADKAPTISEGDPASYIDDDIFGFMQAVSGKTRRRTAPVRVSPAVGLFPLNGDRDYGTKTKGFRETESGGQELTGNIFETEIYNNCFRNTVLVELDRFGVFQDFELGNGSDIKKSISQEERKRRLSIFVDALFTIWGGGKQSRLLTDVGPKLLIYTRQKVKNPILLESLLMKSDKEIYIKPVVESLIEFAKYLDKVVVGVRSGFITDENKEALFAELRGANTLTGKLLCGTLAEAKDAIAEDVQAIGG
jgi:CRISPR-associated protein Cst2